MRTPAHRRAAADPSPVPATRDAGIAATAIVLVGSLGTVGVARSLLLPGTFPALARLNPVGGILGALMVLAPPVLAGIWLGRMRTRMATVAGLLGGGAIWLLTGPLFALPAVAESILETNLTTGLPSTDTTSAVATSLRVVARWAALGLPTAMIIGAGLAWCGAEFSPTTSAPRTTADPRSPTIAAGVGTGAAVLLGIYLLASAPRLPEGLDATYAHFIAAVSSATVAPVLCLAPPAVLAVLAATGLRSILHSAPAPRPPQSPISVGAWSFVAVVWAVGLPFALFQTFAVGIWPLLNRPELRTGLPQSIDPATWNAMYDHTLVGLVGGMLIGLAVTTTAALFAPPGGPGTGGPRASGAGW